MRSSGTTATVARGDGAREDERHASCEIDLGYRIGSMAGASAKQKAGGRSGTARATSLLAYAAKRDFAKTPEPPPRRAAPRAEGRATFMVHKHDASRLHYDLRLEMNGALASWAIPKGPSYDPAQKRLAVETEDHPLEYGAFEGRIPDDEYGGGDSLVWDRGTWDTVPPGHADEQRKKGHLHLALEGEKLRGEWHLVRTRPLAGKPQWLFFKARDGFADAAHDVVAERPESVVSGRVRTRGPERAKVLRAPHPPPDALLRKVLPPMLATLVDAPPAREDEWVYELKYDGYRALAGLSSGRVALWSRNGLDLAPRFPRIVEALASIVVAEAVVDAEIVVLDRQGAPRFELIQQGSANAVLFAFDLLWLDGEDLRGEPLEARRDLLTSLVSNAPLFVRLAERIEGPAARALDEAGSRGFEGLLAKRKGSVYEGARTKTWLKLKAQASQELAIVGFTRSRGASSQIGALELAVAEGGRLRYAGKVGTGFTAKQRAELERVLGKDVVSEPRFEGAPRAKDAFWVEPRHVAQVKFTEWTSDGKLRHPSFQGLRSDKRPMECVREEPAHARAAEAEAEVEEAPASRVRPRAASAKRRAAPAARTAKPHTPSARAPAPATVRLTHPDRLLWPRDGITKRQLADYYAAVSEPLLRALADRPLALEHWHEGIDAPSVFKQNVPRHAPAWLRVVDVPARTKPGSVHHLVVDRPEALAWLAQNAALTLHMASSRAPTLDQPDWVVFDLDPAEGRGIEQTIPVALVLRRVFEQLGLPSVPKTSGKRGLHVLVPLARGHGHEEALAFAQAIAGAVARELPEVTLDRAKNRRRGRLYLDTLQNGYGKTIVAPYSPRAIDGAPVSAPLAWSEVSKRLDPMRYTMKTMPKRLDEMGDLFAPALELGVHLPKVA